MIYVIVGIPHLWVKRERMESLLSSIKRNYYGSHPSNQEVKNILSRIPYSYTQTLGFFPTLESADRTLQHGFVDMPMYRYFVIEERPYGLQEGSCFYPAAWRANYKGKIEKIDRPSWCQIIDFAA